MIVDLIFFNRYKSYLHSDTVNFLLCEKFPMLKYNIFTKKAQYMQCTCLPKSMYFIVYKHHF